MENIKKDTAKDDEDTRLDKQDSQMFACLPAGIFAK
jgi:hypothetical protein